jgi:hypothetical protein
MRYRARLSLVAVLVAACGQTTPSEPAAEEPSAAASVAESASVSAGSSDAASSASPSEARLPTAAGPPQPLEAGTYLTPEGFEPAVSITVPDGWYGAAGQSGFGVGQGMNQGEFADAFIGLDLVRLPYDEAVATFGALEGTVFSEPSSTMQLDGHEATVFHGSPLSDHVLLDELVPGIDLTATAHQQILVDVDGQTILIRTELPSDDAEGALAEVIESLQFP